MKVIITMKKRFANSQDYMKNIKKKQLILQKIVVNKMVSYLFKNKKHINKPYLLNNLINNYDLEIIDHTTKNTVLGNTDILVDISKKYISILLYDDTINIKKIKKYLLFGEK